MSRVRAIVTTLRPRQWVKNVFVLAPLVFSKHLLDAAYALPAVGATAAFCAVSGAVYAFNDVRDVEQDREHPVKRFRPIAAGALSERGGVLLAAILAVLAVGGSLLSSWQLAAVVAGYLVNNLIYSIGGKHVPYLDVLMIAAGFVLRVVAGGIAIDVPLSTWLIVCTALLSAMLGFGKRAHELANARSRGSKAETTRVSLGAYRMKHLRVAIVTTAVATCAAFALYTQDTHTVTSFGTRALIATTPFCIIGIARFAQLALRRGGSESPTDAMLRDWPFLVNLVAWGTAVLYIIYR